jgi:hypothetical protein
MSAAGATKGTISCSTHPVTFSLTLAITGSHLERHVPDVLPLAWISFFRQRALHLGPVDTDIVICAEAFISTDGIFRYRSTSVRKDSALQKLYTAASLRET